HLRVADKPPFRPVTPGGRYVQETLLVRLKHELGLNELSPLHRLDRETAGVVAFCLRPQDRDAYQRLFRERQVHKVYEALARVSPTAGGGHTPVPDPATLCPLVRRSHIRENPRQFFRMEEAPDTAQLPPNSETRIDLLHIRDGYACFRLEPVTGKRHQLRVHMAALGWPLAGDQFYPDVLREPGEVEDFSQPLQLLARQLAFTDPVTGQQRCFESQLSLTCA
ncbi:MAG: pseudouridine synthase, partial [Burkholderiaceae bacterium]